jgi:hypothetical protein
MYKQIYSREGLANGEENIFYSLDDVCEYVEENLDEKELLDEVLFELGEDVQTGLKDFILENFNAFKLFFGKEVDKCIYDIACEYFTEIEG